jgi:hypothetical protein
MLTFIYFSLALSTYFASSLDKLTCIWFLIIWVFNWDITLAYFCYLFPIDPPADLFRGISTHSVPLLLTLVDFAMNKIVFVRVQYAIPVLTIIGYGLLVLLPFTLEVEVIYKGIDFEGWISYALLIGLVFFGLAILEVGKLLKEKAFKDKNSDLELSLV